jgi:hypothetical protein
MNARISVAKVSMTVLISSLISVLCIAPANAIELGSYEKLKNTELFKNQIHGVGTGYLWANTELAIRKQPLLYCQPKIALNAENYLQILSGFLERKTQFKAPFDNSVVAAFPVEALLLEALQDAFPCK